ncbi:MAG: polysaccharide biosynthesis/export family protein [Gemmatimonadaceae bacterium]
MTHSRLKGAVQSVCLLLIVALPHLSAAQTANALGPGDRVILRLPGETAVAETLSVDQRGVVTLPRVGPINGSAMGPGQLADSIRTLYARVYLSGDVYLSLLRRITVFGEVNKPGVLFLETTASIRDAIASAQGVTGIAEIRHVNLIRGDISERLENWSALSAQTKPLRSGDALMVDRESWVRRNVPAILGALGLIVSIAVAVTR